jgi:Asp-tRNA(Asn)/Glu-tRNA(Gln) amidotransferase A subunit family amidase
MVVNNGSTREAEQRLHRIPSAISRCRQHIKKDLEETEGLLTTYGSPLFRANLPTRDNQLVRRLRDAGAIMVGKTNVPEMGAGANTRNPVWGATGNPFNPPLNAGGSSGGPRARPCSCGSGAFPPTGQPARHPPRTTC